jgi:hypothetical protein
MNRVETREQSASKAIHREAPAADHDDGLPDAVWWIPLILVAVIPGLLTQAMRTIHSASLRFAISVTLAIVGLALLTAAVLYRFIFTRNVRRTLAVTTALVFVFFTWVFWTAFGSAVGKRFGIDVIGDVATVLLPILIVWIAARFGESDRYVAITTGIALVLAALLCAVVVPRFQSPRGAPVALQDGGSLPNTVLLILDGHARADVLAADYGFDGSQFTAELEDRGFVVRPDALSNYDSTYASLSSMMAMGYPLDEGMRDSADEAKVRELLSGVSPLVGAYREAGYTITKFENAWAGALCSSWIDECPLPGFLRHYLWTIGQLTPLAPIIRSSMPHPFSAIGLQVIRELPDALNADASPQLIVAHATVPHAPAQLDASCGFHPQDAGAVLHLVDPGDTDEEIAAARARYVGQVECVDREVLAAIDQMLDVDPGLAIFVIADHGPDSRGTMRTDQTERTDDALIERMSVLSAMRVPPGCAEDGPALTTVNTIRRLASCSLGVDLPAVPDRVFLAPREELSDVPFVEISDRLSSTFAAASR